MCRLFAQMSPSPVSARDFLIDSKFSLLRQVEADPDNPQKDGWGLAWFGDDGRAHLAKSAASAAREPERFSAAAEAARSSVVLGHIRAASNPHLDEAHAHPFCDDGWVFAHNGTLTIWPEVAQALGPRRARLKTNSDSEVYFQQFLKHLEREKDASRAFEACINESWSLWQTCKDRYLGADTPYTSLNAVASNAHGLHAVCHASRKGLANAGVCHPDQPWSVMSFSMRDGRFILASEGLDGGPWTRLHPPETISAVGDGGGIDIRRRPLSLSSAHGPVPEVSRQ
ncbi:MAG: class II glutamine amidotransferase [Elusimicrobiota bacterium]